MMTLLTHLWTRRKRLDLYQLIGLGAGIAIALIGCSPIATSEAVQQVEQTFADHQPVFTELTTTAVASLQASGDSQLKLPDSSFYDSAWAAETLNSEAIAVSFVIEEFYLPLVYISTDDPEDVHDTCTNGGKVVKQLKPYWYICQRDWN
ncbi:MAG: hypothetical protein AAGF98_07085 [Cyanobacteria bacterium P01_H01_bin.153]